MELGEGVQHPLGDSVGEVVDLRVVEVGAGISAGGFVGNTTGGVAGGGGSYNIGANKQNLTGVNKGDGKVIITLEN